MVTGASGYIGGRLAAHLVGEGMAPVRAVSRRPAAHVVADEHVRLDLPLAPLPDLVAACRGIGTVIHLAGGSEVLFAAQPDQAFADTVAASRRLAAAAATAAVSRFVYVSTVHVYGAALTPGTIATEELLPAPRGGYAVARLASEYAIAGELSGSATDLVVLRVTNVVGAPVHPSVSRWTLVANDLCRQVATSRQLVLQTHGTQWRDFITLQDLCRAAVRCFDTAAVPAGTYNLGAGEPVTIRSVASVVVDVAKDLTGMEIALEAPDPPADPQGPYFVSVTRLAHLGVRPCQSLRAGIDELLRFCLAHRDEL